MLSISSAMALATSYLQNGKLYVPLAKSYIELAEIADELRDDLLDYKIPHYKVVGAQIVTGNVTQIPDVVTKPNAVNKSYVELIPAFDNLAWATLEPAITPVGTENLQSVDYSTLYAFKEEVKSDNGAICYPERGTKGPESLIKGVDVIELHQSAGLKLIAIRGTGFWDFPDSNKLLYRTQYIPFRQCFNLTTVFTIGMVRQQDNCIHFNYKQDVNEDVLIDIIHKYAEDRLEEEEE